MKNSFWNLPRKVTQPRYEFLEKLFKDFFDDRSFSMIEIGVHKGDLVKKLQSSSLNILNYDGVDPYLGDTSDYYTGAYWNDNDEAQNMYENVKKLFSQNYTLHRLTSKEFFDKDINFKYDLVYIDGDHGLEATLWDLSHWFFRTKVDGIMCVDDYASSDHPQVTIAVNKFIDIFEPYIESMGYRSYEMYTNTKNKKIPVSKANAFFQPKNNLTKDIWIELLQRL